MHRNKNGVKHWEMPGGKIESVEFPEQTAIRETEEDLGVKAKLLSYLAKMEFISGATTCVFHWFTGRTTEGVPRLLEPRLFDELDYNNVVELDVITLSPNLQNLVSSLKPGGISLA